MNRRQSPPLSAGGPLELGALLEAFTDPVTLEAGHPLRRMRCLACASLIGGREIRLYTITVLSPDNCPCGSIPTLTYAVCADHGTEGGQALPNMALHRWSRHHGEAEQCGTGR